MLRWHTFRIILLTSFIWICLGFGALFYYSSACIGNDCIKSSIGGKQSKLHESHSSRNHILPSPVAYKHDAALGPYSDSQLHEWEPVVLKKNPSSWPGENGKGVKTPKEEEEEKKEKFKLNQFNILASDRIALNRSLPNVNMEQ